MTPEELKDYRKNLGMSQACFGNWLAQKLNGEWYRRTGVTVYNWEKGIHPIPDWISLLNQEPSK
jgi:DNA-binding transcriptional regulator YiaG